MKKYLLVQWDSYYPRAGLKNLKGSFDTVEEAKENKMAGFDHTEIIDRDTLDVVFEEDEMGYNV